MLSIGASINFWLHGPHDKAALLKSPVQEQPHFLQGQHRAWRTEQALEFSLSQGPAIRAQTAPLLTKNLI